MNILSARKTVIEDENYKLMKRKEIILNKNKIVDKNVNDLILVNIKV